MALAFEKLERELRVEASTKALVAAFSLSLAEAEFVQAILVGVGSEPPSARLCGFRSGRQLTPFGKS